MEFATSCVWSRITRYCSRSHRRVNSILTAALAFPFLVLRVGLRIPDAQLVSYVFASHVRDDFYSTRYITSTFTQSLKNAWQSRVSNLNLLIPSRVYVKPLGLSRWRLQECIEKMQNYKSQTYTLHILIEVQYLLVRGGPLIWTLLCIWPPCTLSTASSKIPRSTYVR